MKEIAIIGATASGKSALALEIAARFNANILSLDTLSIYKEIDIVSAKPTKNELASVPHFGIDVVYPNEHFSVERFIHIYKGAKEQSKKEGKNLIVVGGSSFYLKTLLQGISPLPPFNEETKKEVELLMHSLPKAYCYLQERDPDFAQKIAPNDRYRIEKGLLILLQTSLTPSQYFKLNPPQKIASMKIFAIDIAKEELRNRILQRTKIMVKMGLIDEIYYLEKKYTRAIAPMKAIGIKETLDYFDGNITTLKALIDTISIHTAQLAKRQRTFNKTQFPEKISLPLPALKKAIAKELAD